MGKYFVLQLKRLLRCLLGALLAAAVLLGAFLLVFRGFSDAQSGSEENTRISIGLVGTGEETLLQLGIDVLSSVDATRFAFKLLPMDRQQAEEDLHEGKIMAYVAFPEGFMDSALHGYVPAIEYVSRPGAGGLVAMLRDEFTLVIADVLEAAQKGVYGTQGALMSVRSGQAGALTGEISVAYAQLLLNRSKMYEVEYLGVSQGLDFAGHLLCGLTVLLLFLLTLPFSAKLIGREFTLERLLKAKGFGPGRQLACVAGAYFTVLILLLAALLLGMDLASSGGIRLLGLRDLIGLLPVAALAAALSLFLCTLAEEFISGILLQFLCCVFLCFVSGCLYPAHFFPEGLQWLGAVLPAGCAYRYLASYMQGSLSAPLWPILLWTAVLLGAALLLRVCRLSDGKGVER